MKLWSQLTKDELQLLINSGKTTAVLPVGSIEQHGAHLSLGYDSFIAERLAIDLAKELEAILIPSFQYGSADHHLGFVGTLSLSEQTFIAVLNNLAKSIAASGIRNLIIVNGHGGNYGPISRFISAWDDTSLKVITDSEERLIFRAITDLGASFPPAKLGLHGGLFETSLALHTHPGSVRQDQIRPGLLPQSGDAWTDDEIKELICKGLIESTDSGVIGDPTGSTHELGQQFYQILYRGYLELCRNFV
jgi:creatinine amidohydrolase